MLFLTWSQSAKGSDSGSVLSAPTERAESCNFAALSPVLIKGLFVRGMFASQGYKVLHSNTDPGPEGRVSEKFLNSSLYPHQKLKGSILRQSVFFVVILLINKPLWWR